jgi:hypothetical protein
LQTAEGKSFGEFAKLRIRQVNQYSRIPPDPINTILQLRDLVPVNTLEEV